MIPAGTFSLFHFPGCFFYRVRIWLTVLGWRFDLITVKPADQQFTGLVSSVKVAISHTPAKTSIWISQLLLVQGNTLKSKQVERSCSGIHKLMFVKLLPIFMFRCMVDEQKLSIQAYRQTHYCCSIPSSI